MTDFRAICVRLSVTVLRQLETFMDTCKLSWYFLAFEIEAIDVPLFQNETIIGSSPAGWARVYRIANSSMGSPYLRSR